MHDDSKTRDFNYDFVSPRKIVFGWGRRREVGVLGRSLGKRAFVISGSRTLAKRGVVQEVFDLFCKAGIEPIEVGTISREPEVDDVDTLSAKIRDHNASPDDFIVAIGGGAAIDLAKAVAAMATNRQTDTVKDYLENVGLNLKIAKRPLPILAMPTTAGTGAEATKNAVISSYDPPFKKSFRDLQILPQIALLDPELTVSCSPGVTAASGLDAITQLIESYISRRAQPIPSALAESGLKMALEALPKAVEEVTNRTAREKMAHASLISGICLANSGLGMAHGIAPAIGVHCRVTHGIACAVLLPSALKINRSIREPELARLSRIAFGLASTVPANEAVDILIERIENLCDRVGIPKRLSQLGIRKDQLPMIAASSRGNSMQGNPQELSDEQLKKILEELL